jgi:serine/threonine protein kinase, bacterial
MLSAPAEGDQRVLLGDFGIARRVDDSNNLTATNMTVGTVFYAAPEQLMGEDLDGRADQYALAATAFHLLSGSPPFHHSNPTVVISQHLTASPPALSDRRPELSALDPVLAKALSKDPKDRFVSCMDFSRALAHRLGVEPLADIDRTEASVPINLRPQGGGRHEAHQQPGRKYLRPAFIVPAILAVLLLVAIALVLIQFREIEKLLNDDYTPPPSAPPATAPRAEAPPSSAPTTTVTASAQATPAAAVVGADCSPLGSSATTANGNTVYCSTLESTGATIWSTSQGEVPAPTVTVTTDVTDEPLPLEQETPVRVCMQETGKTRRECREAIRASNDGGN